MLVGILGGSQSTDTFSGGTFTAAKAYLTFVLCFVALTSIIVSPYCTVRLYTVAYELFAVDHTALVRIDNVPPCSRLHWVNAVLHYLYIVFTFHLSSFAFLLSSLISFPISGLSDVSFSHYALSMLHFLRHLRSPLDYYYPSVL